MRARYAREIRHGIAYGRLYADAKNAGGHVAAYGLVLGFVNGNGDLAVRAFQRTIHRLSHTGADRG